MSSNKFSDWDNEPLLGRIPDRELAELRGCSRQNVTAARRARGIVIRDRPHGPGLDKAIRRALGNRFTSRPSIEIHHEVLNDYGSVSRREIERHLLAMLSLGEVDVDYERCYRLTPVGLRRKEADEIDESDDDEAAWIRKRRRCS